MISPGTPTAVAFVPGMEEYMKLTTDCSTAQMQVDARTGNSAVLQAKDSQMPGNSTRKLLSTF